MMKNVLKACALSMLVLAACNNSPKNKKETDKKENASVVHLKTDDEMIAAFKDTAQAKLPVFIDSLKPHALDSNYRFLVKSDFAEGKDHEHMWSVVYKYGGGKFTGIFADSAIVLKKLKMGAPVLIDQKDVEDWAIYDYKRNTDMGNFSDKYLRSKQKEGK
jgi:uncharacterized protein YegJ (DUF2314 family)